VKASDIRVITRAIDHGTEVQAELRLTHVARVDAEAYHLSNDALGAAKEYCRRSIIEALYGQIRRDAMKAFAELKYRMSYEDSLVISELMSPLLNAGNELKKERVDSPLHSMH
jgi:hypothetical protein